MSAIKLEGRNGCVDISVEAAAMSPIISSGKTEFRYYSTEHLSVGVEILKIIKQAYDVPNLNRAVHVHIVSRVLVVKITEAWSTPQGLKDIFLFCKRLGIIEGGEAVLWKMAMLGKHPKADCFTEDDKDLWRLFRDHLVSKKNSKQL